MSTLFGRKQTNLPKPNSIVSIVSQIGLQYEKRKWNEDQFISQLYIEFHYHKKQKHAKIQCIYI